MENNAQRPVVVITGSAGLIGSRLTQAFARDHQVVGLDVVPPKQQVEGTEWIECDLTHDRSVSHALDSIRGQFGEKIASMLHLAAYYDFSGEPSPLYQELTVEGTRRLLRGLQSLSVEQFAFSSTLLVMKPVDDQADRLTEDSPTQAEWDYPRSKLETEQVIQAERGSIPAAILRIAGVYDEDCHSIPISQQIKRIYERELESYFYPGNKRLGQSFVHLDDVVSCFARVVERRRELSDYEVFLVGEDDVVSYGELQEFIGELLYGRAWPTIRVPKAVAKVGAWVEDKLLSEESFIKPWMIDLADAHYPVDNTRARTVLGWEPKHTLRGTLKEMIERLNADPRRWYETNQLPVPQELQSV